MGKVKKTKQELLKVSDRCINCQEYLALDQRFCSHCGGKRMHNRITWRNLFVDFVDRFLNIENAFLRTFLTLFKKPEDVIGGYMLGMRKKYLPAFSYFAVALTVAGVSSFVIKNWFMEEMIQAQTNIYEGEAAEIQKAFSSKWLNFIMEYVSFIYFLTIPILALLSRVVFWNYKKYNLVEHFVIYLYGYSHVTMITTTLGLVTIWNQGVYGVFGMITPFLMIAYMTYVLKRLFKLDTANTILKVSLFLVVLLGLIIILSIGGVIIGFFMAMTGALDDIEFLRIIKEQEAAKKALKETAIIVKDSIHRDTMKAVLKVVKDSIPL